MTLKNALELRRIVVEMDLAARASTPSGKRGQLRQRPKYLSRHTFPFPRLPKSVTAAASGR